MALNLHRKISIGLPCAADFEEFRDVVDEFGEYLHGLYFSPPLPVAAFHTRLALSSLLAREGAEDDALRCVDHARARGLKLELALNAADSEEAARAALDYARYRGIRPDEIVALARFAELARSYFPEARLVYSYNNGLRTASDLDAVPACFDDVVLGGACIRQRAFLARLREKGFGTRLLVNNGCSFDCAWCRNSSLCEPTFERNLAAWGPTRLYALQSIFPEELRDEYRDADIDVVKLSTRPSDRATFRGMIASYVEGEARPWVARDPMAWRLWCRLSHFAPHFESLDFSGVSEAKKAIWEGRDFAETVS